MSTLSWQAGNAADSFLTGTMAQALIVFNKPDYEPQRWQGTLIVFAMVCFGLRMMVSLLTGHAFLDIPHLHIQHLGSQFLAARAECTYGAACTFVLCHHRHPVVSSTAPHSQGSVHRVL
jgi:hypothetical protein